jgi:hypothetical protein
MKSMNATRVGEFTAYLKNRIDRHNQKMPRALARHRVLIKTERAEAEVILEAFVEILNGKARMRNN